MNASSVSVWDHLVVEADRLLARCAVTGGRNVGGEQSVLGLVAGLVADSRRCIDELSWAQVDSVLPGLAAVCRGGDQAAMVVAAAVMRPCLRRIARWADPDGFDRTEAAVSASFTLEAFYRVLVAAPESDEAPVTSKIVYRRVLRAVLDNRKTRPTAETETRYRPGCEVFDAPDDGDDVNIGVVSILDHAVTHRVITPIERRTLDACYPKNSAVKPDLKTVAQQLGTTTSAVQRRTHRAITKLHKKYAPKTAKTEPMKAA